MLMVLHNDPAKDNELSSLNKALQKRLGLWIYSFFTSRIIVWDWVFNLSKMELDEVEDEGTLLSRRRLKFEMQQQ